MHGEWLRKPTGPTSVVFVHGILSSGEKCWRHANGAYWPELLNHEPDLASLGIYVYTYQTGFDSGSYSLSNVVDDLKERVFTLDGVADSKKIVFVCHSMGGIVVRKFIVERVNDLLDRKIEIGLYLVASPSLGSNYANWLEPIAQFAGHEQAKALTLSQANQWLNDLDKNFINLKESKRLTIHGKELLEDKFVTLTNLFRKQVVEPFSGARYFSESFKVTCSDHFSIAKPESKSSDQHRLLKAFILRMNPKQETATYQERPVSTDCLTTPFLSESGMNVSESINVFVSYSWAVEKDTKIVEELDRLCQQRGIKLIRDNNGLKHGESIKKFMDKLSNGDHVITIFSKPYFQSKWCMKELLCIYQRENFEQRTHPVIADECDLQDEDYRLQVVDYWNKQFETFRDKLKGRDTLAVKTEYDQLELYRDLYQQINKIVNFARDRLTTPLAELKEQNFTQLLDRIKPVSQPSSGETETKVEDKAAIAIQQDQAFLKEVHNSLSSLKQSSKFYHDKLVKECHVPLKEANDLPSYLIKQCLEGNFSEIVRNMETAFANCLKEMDANNTWEINAVIQTAEDLISKLVLFNVKREWIEEHYTQSALAVEPNNMLPEMNLTAVEVVTSRQSQTIPRFQVSGKGMRDINIDKVFTLEAGINHGMDAFLKSLHSNLLGNQLNDGLDRKALIEDINDTIRYRKKHKDIALRKRYFILVPSDELAPLANKELQVELAQLVPELEWITLKTGTREQVFLVTDGELKTAIREFFTTLANFNPKNPART